MRACRYPVYGPPAVLMVENVAKPSPSADEILVRVHCATVNRTDTGLRTANYFVSRLYTGLIRPSLPISGTDFAGVVEAVGTNVSRFNVGDRVFGFDDQGLQSHAEYLTINADKAIETIPENTAFDQAAASMEGAHYAINFLNKVDIQAGDRIMVYGASGAIGSAMTQLLVAQGVEVTAVCGSNAVERIETFNPVKVIDYQRVDFTKDEWKYKAVFDAVGKETFGRCKVLLEKPGFYISSELGPYGQNIWYSLLAPLMGPRKVRFPLPLDIHASIKRIKGLLESGEFKPLIERSYAFEDIESAFEHALSAKKLGNLVVNMG